MAKKSGKIIPNGVLLEKHENNIVVTLTNEGLDIELIPRSYIKNVHTPDAMINGEPWEFKSPKGKGRWLIENTLQKAARQAPNIVIDLRRIKIPEQKCLAKLEKEFSRRKNIKKLKIITKSGKIIDF